MKVDRFVLLLLAMIALAYFVPGIEKVIPLHEISTYGISGIFFFYGLKLHPEKMKSGLSNWKLHALIQAATFMVFPMIVLAFLPFMDQETHYTLWLTVFFLAALPSTVSSSVVMVSIARGNIPAAIFNASLSSLVGIVVTPLWMGIFMEAQNTSFDLGNVFLELLAKIILPVALGMAMHRFWGSFAEKHKNQLAMFDKAIILIIVYLSFSSSFAEKMFEAISWTELLFLGLAVISLFVIMLLLLNVVSKKLHFSIEDRITAMFCGSKKSLVHGTVFSNVLFSSMANAGIFLVPIMVYHAFQLFVISIVAERFHRRIE